MIPSVLCPLNFTLHVTRRELKKIAEHANGMIPCFSSDFMNILTFFKQWEWKCLYQEKLPVLQYKKNIVLP